MKKLIIQDDLLIVGNGNEWKIVGRGWVLNRKGGTHPSFDNSHDLWKRISMSALLYFCLSIWV